MRAYTVCAMTHLSDSSPQCEAEELIREALAQTLDTPLKAQKMALGENSSVQIDEVSPDESVLVEIFAHQEMLKGGRKHKVKRRCAEADLAGSNPSLKSTHPCLWKRGSRPRRTAEELGC
jgi:hypothetical protein